MCHATLIAGESCYVVQAGSELQSTGQIDQSDSRTGRTIAEAAPADDDLQGWLQLLPGSFARVSLMIGEGIEVIGDVPESIECYADFRSEANWLFIDHRAHAASYAEQIRQHAQRQRDAWQGVLEKIDPFAVAAKEQRYTLAWVNEAGEVERTFGEYRRAELAELETVVGLYREARKADLLDYDLQIVPVA